MKTHILTVRDRRASTSTREMVQGTVGEDRVVLDLDAEWEGLDLSVTFIGAGRTVAPAPNSGGTYTVPWECLAEAGQLRAVVEGRRGSDLLAHATMVTPWRVLPRDVPDGPADPSDPTVDELQAAKAGALEAAETARDAAEKVLASRITGAVAETLPPSSAATAEVVGNELRLGIPKGETGGADFGILHVDGGDLYATYTSEIDKYEFALSGAELEVSLVG